MGEYVITIADWATNIKPYPRVQVHIEELSGDITTPIVNLLALQAAILGTSLGEMRKYAYSNTGVGTDPVGSESAKRQLRWLVPFTDDVTGLAGSFTIPAANPALTAIGTDLMDTAEAAYTSLKNNVEATVRSNAGNAVTMGVPRLVGR